MDGRLYVFDFEVVHGNKLGREIRFPTITQPFPDDYMRPRFGVYASKVRLDGRKWAGATNIGCKPTVGSGRILAETNIIGYNDNLYHQRVRVELVDFLRGEEKFDSVELLVQQMRRDCSAIERIAEQY